MSPLTSLPIDLKYLLTIFHQEDIQIITWTSLRLVFLSKTPEILRLPMVIPVLLLSCACDWLVVLLPRPPGLPCCSLFLFSPHLTMSFWCLFLSIPLRSLKSGVPEASIPVFLLWLPPLLWTFSCFKNVCRIGGVAQL